MYPVLASTMPTHSIIPTSVECMWHYYGIEQKTRIELHFMHELPAGLSRQSGCKINSYNIIDFTHLQPMIKRALAIYGPWKIERVLRVIKVVFLYV